jgi:hypothetical protein
MKQLSHRRLLCLVFVAVLPACRTEDKTPEQTPVATAPNVVSLTATEYAFQGPDSIPAGWTTLRLTNNGQEVHYGHIVRLDSGRTVPQLVDAYTEAIRTSGPRPKWVKRFGGPGGAAPGGSANVTQYLEPGSYVWICPIEDSTGAPHFGKGEVKAFVVHGAVPAARPAAPEASTVVRLMDFSFDVDSTLRAGRHTIRVENAGVEPHDLVLMKLAPGRTLEDVQTVMNPERARRTDKPADPSLSFESLGMPAGGIAAIGQGMESFFEAEFSAGDYVLICMATAPDGRSHIEHGMIRRIKVE